MEHSQELVYTLIFLCAAVVIIPIFHRFRISPILGYLAAGIIIGPHSLGLVAQTKAIHTLAEFGVVFLLFMIGLELSVERLRAIGNRIFFLGLLQVVITSIVIGIIASMLGFSPQVSAVIGGGLALSSTAFVMRYLAETGERATRMGMVVFAILLVQDLAAVPFLIFVQLFANQDASFIEAFGGAALKGAAALIIVLVLGKFLLNPIYKIIATARSSELFVAATLLLILGIGWVMALAGLSMTLGAFLAGLMLSGTQYRHQIESDIRPFRGLLLGLFFMTIGMSINLSLIINQWQLILLLLAGLMIGKTLITALLARALGNSTKCATQTGLALSQGGEFGFIMFGAALTLNLMPQNLVNLLLAVIALSMILTPAMFALGRWLGVKLTPSSDQPDAIEQLNQDQVQNQAQNQANEFVLIAGFGRVGQTVAKVLADAEISYIALDLDQARVANCRKKGLDVFYGNADNIAVLKSAGVDCAKAAIITLDDETIASNVVSSLRRNYPDLPIYVRARDRRHTKILEQAGATAMVSEAAEASLQLGSIVLKALNVSTDEIASVISEYREDDYALLDDIIGADAKQK